MTDTATLQVYLAQLEAAEQQLLLGKQTASVGYGDTRVEYNKTDLTAIRARIVEIKAQLDPTGCKTRRRAIGVRFG
nr:gpW family head-tail joining protein [uncultured Dongia sp.]